MPKNKNQRNSDAVKATAADLPANAGHGEDDPKIDDLGKNAEDSSGEYLTTNQGVRINDNQNSLKAGNRGPSLLEDFILREKITHFDHERIPERVVHARGSAAHGYFQVMSQWLNTRRRISCRIRRLNAGVRTLFDRGRLSWIVRPRS